MLDSLKKLASPFIGFEENKDEVAPANFPQTKSTALPASSPFTPTKPIENPYVAKFQNYFTDLMKKMDLPGPDYCEFAQTKEELREDIPDEQKRFIRAAKIAKVSKLKLMDSAGVYIDGFLKDKVAFSAQLSEKESREIGTKRAEIADLEKKNKEIDDLISKKRKESEDNALVIQKLEEEIHQADEKIKANEEAYTLAFNEKIAIIKQDIEKISVTEIP